MTAVAIYEKKNLPQNGWYGIQNYKLGELIILYKYVSGQKSTVLPLEGFENVDFLPIFTKIGHFRHSIFSTNGRKRNMLVRDLINQIKAKTNLFLTNPAVRDTLKL